MGQLLQAGAASQVFVGGTFGVKKQELCDHFETCGIVSSVRLAYIVPGRRRGFGFIQFKLASSAQQASLVGLQHNVAGRLVTVKPVRQKFHGTHTRQTQAQHRDSTLKTARMSLLDILHQIPTLPEILTPDSHKALSATCKSCHVQFSAQVQLVTVLCKEDYALICQRRWPRLCIVILQDKHAFYVESQPSKSTRIIDLHVSATGGSRATIFLLRSLHNLAIDLPWTHLAAQQLADQMTRRWPLMSSFTMSHMMSRKHDPDDLGLEMISQLVKGTWTQLQNLNLSECELNTKAFMLLSQGNWPGLTTLDVSGNCLVAEGMAYLAKGNWPLLTTIHLSFNPKLDAIAVAHLSAANWPVKSLRISHTPFDADMAAELADLQLPNLMTLDLMGSGLTAAISELARGHWPNLCILTLGHGDTAAVAVLLGLDPVQVQVAKSDARDSDRTYRRMQRRIAQTGVVGLWPNLKWVRVTKHSLHLTLL